MTSPNEPQSEIDRLLADLSQGELTEEQVKRLEHLVLTKPEDCRRYVRYQQLCASLEWELSGGIAPVLDGGSPASTENIDSTLGKNAEIIQLITEEEARIAGLSAEKFMALQRERDQQSLPKSRINSWKSLYVTVATVASVAAMLTLLIHWTVAAPTVVASIEDSIDARWSDPSLSTAPGTPLSTVGSLVLTHGVVEIMFEGGAKVIVESPATFELLSESSARLVQGRLVGLVPRSDVQLTIKTPGASITDLGTEFGVSVDPQQVTHLHVFKGRVSVATFDAHGRTAQQQTVFVNKTVHLQPKTGAIEPASVDTASRFVRRLLFPLPLYSTGVGLVEGDEDPHWQIVAAQNVADFVPQRAIVATPALSYGPNDSQKSQWVSLAKNLPRVDPEASYTFSSVFDLSGFDSATASIRGFFSVDNRVTAIRINGTEIPVPKHGDEDFQKIFSFFLDPNLLKASRNDLELDVFNSVKPQTPTLPSAITLRVLLKGTGQKIQ